LLGTTTSCNDYAQRKFQVVATLIRSFLCMIVSTCSKIVRHDTLQHNKATSISCTVDCRGKVPLILFAAYKVILLSSQWTLTGYWKLIYCMLKRDHEKVMLALVVSWEKKQLFMLRGTAFFVMC